MTALPLLYFLVGLLSGIAGAFAWVMRYSTAPPAPKRRGLWKYIKSARFQWNFDWAIEHRVKMIDVLEALPDLMQKQLAKTPVNESGVTEVEPGQYTVELSVSARFIARDVNGGES